MKRSNCNYKFTSEAFEKADISRLSRKPVNQETSTMVQSKEKFISTYTRVIGEPENTQRFIDALHIVNDGVGTQLGTVVRMIKSKLVGKARTCILDTDNSIDLIIARLHAKVKGESTKLISCKLMNLKQSGKSANNYAAEVEIDPILKNSIPALAYNYSLNQAI